MLLLYVKQRAGATCTPRTRVSTLLICSPHEQKFTSTIRTASALESFSASWLKCKPKTKKAHIHPEVSRYNFQYIYVIHTQTYIYVYVSVCVCVKLLQLCPTLCDSMDYSPPGSSVLGISQARIPEWVAISSSRGSSPLRDQTCLSSLSCFAGGYFTAEPPGKHIYIYFYNSQQNSPKCSTWMQSQNLKNDRMISVRLQGKPFNIMVIQVYAPTSNAEEAEVEWFYVTYKIF